MEKGEFNINQTEFTFHHLGLYVTIAYAFLWLFWLPQLMHYNNIISLLSMFAWIVGFIAPWGPFIAAFSVTFLVKGKEGVKILLKRGVDTQFEKKQLIPTILLFPTQVGIAFLIGIITTTTSISLPWFTNPFWLLFNFEYSNIMYLFIFTGVAEEFGWRVFALDILQKKFNASVSTIVLGIIWACWHLPIFFLVGSIYQIEMFILVIV